MPRYPAKDRRITPDWTSWLSDLGDVLYNLHRSLLSLGAARSNNHGCFAPQGTDSRRLQLHGPTKGLFSHASLRTFYQPACTFTALEYFSQAQTQFTPWPCNPVKAERPMSSSTKLFGVITLCTRSFRKSTHSTLAWMSSTPWP